MVTKGGSPIAGNQFCLNGCKRNATTKPSKTANIARAPVLTHVAARELHRLRPGTCETRPQSKAPNKAPIETNFFKLFILVMTLSIIVPAHQVDAASMHHRQRARHVESPTSTVRYVNKAEKIFQQEICSIEVKWENACRGQWDGDGSNATVTTAHEHVPHYQALKVYNNILKSIYKELKSNTTEIDISDTNKTWAAHKRNYRFLPRLKPNSTVKLRSWHRQVQVYAASFNYLRRAQLYFDLKKFSEESHLSRVLKRFEQAALMILCEIEATINITSRANRPLRFYKPERMKRNLKFRTEMKYFFDTNCKEHDLDQLEEPGPANGIDLRYAKKHFLGFLRSMRKALNQKIASGSSISRSSSGSSMSRSHSYSSSDSATSASDYKDNSLQILSRSDNVQNLQLNRIAAKKRGMRRHHKKSN